MGVSRVQPNILLYLLLIIIPISCSKGKSEDFTVMTGSFRQSIIETGELEAIKAIYYHDAQNRLAVWLPV